MATNQVLNVNDEIIDGDEEFYITDNANGTHNIALANSIINQGTEFNRALFNKVDNVLSFLTPAYTRSISGSTQTSSYASVSVPNSSSSLTWSAGERKSFSDYTLVISKQPYTIGSTYVNAGTYTPTITYKIKGNTYKSATGYDRRFCVGSPENTTYREIACFSGGNLGSSTDFLNNESTIGTSSGNYNNQFICESGDTFYIYIDLKQKSYFSLRYYFSLLSGIFKLYWSDDNSSWNLHSTLVNGTDTTISIAQAGAHRYWKIESDEITNGGTLNIFAFLLQTISVERISEVNTYHNDFTLDNNGNTFTTNQIILVQPNASTSSVNGNTLNGKNINTLLQSGTKYRLLYNGTQFVATTQ